MNPMELFNKNLSPEQLQHLQMLQLLLGGLGKQPASRVISPSLAEPPPQPLQGHASQRPILGGTGSG